MHARIVAGWLGLLLLVPAADAPAAQFLYKERLELLATKPGQPAPGEGNADSLADALAFDAFGRRFEVELEPNRALIAAAGRLARGRGLGIYRGRLKGVPQSWVRIVLEDGRPAGLIFDGAEFWGLETLESEAGGALAPHVFRLGDLIVEPGTLACSSHAPAATAAQIVDALSIEAEPIIERAAGAAAEIDLAVVADFEFATARGSGSEAALIARINNVDGIFSSQLGVQVNISRIDTFDGGSDPFTDATDAETLLGELADYRFATPAHRSSGLTHMFTGRNLDGTTVGIAYSSAVCSSRFGAGITQGTHSTTVDSLIAAHEIGHNFGAPHDGTQDSACQSEPQIFLMAPSINGSDQFSACSVEQMQARIASAVCITPLASADVELVASQVPASILLGDSVDLSFEANNIGSGGISDAVVEIAIPAGTSLDAITATGGSCTSGGGAASCTIPAIAPGSGSTVTLTVTPLDAGAVDIDAAVTAAGDQDPTNNDVSVRLTTAAAVDLAAIADGGAEIEISGAIALEPVIENRASIAATDLIVTISVSSGLQINSADWPFGPCAIDAGVATCEAATLAAGAAAPLSLELTGSAAGSQSYVVTVAPAEPDRVTGNNSAAGQVTVTSPTSPTPADSTPPAAAGASGGGGVFGWPSFLLLLVAGWLHDCRHRRRVAVGAVVTRAAGRSDRRSE